jgi:hypothetical protein
MRRGKFLVVENNNLETVTALVNRAGKETSLSDCCTIMHQIMNGCQFYSKRQLEVLEMGHGMLTT